jgi:RNA polymerase sigma-70 factor, ECF subfamily
MVGMSLGLTDRGSPDRAVLTLCEAPAAPAREITEPETGMDEEAFRAFYDRTARPLWAYLLRTLGRGDLAEDLLQESYCRFLSAQPADMNEAESKSYLFRIATNLMNDRWRRRKSIATMGCEFEPITQDHHLEARAQVRQAFGRLKARERQLLWLAYVEGSSHREIAGITGLGTASIRLLLFRARRRLAELLDVCVRSSKEKVTI